MEERDLVENLKEGKEAAYKHLFYNYFEPLCFYAHGYLKDMDAARDLVQEVFSYIYENRADLSIRESLKAYLYRSVGNRSLNLLKHFEVRERHHRDIGERADHLYQDEQIELAELQARINKAIDELPPQCAKIFRMNRFEHKSNAEIASELNISKRTVETQISNALKVLRSVLKMAFINFLLDFF